MGYSSNAAPDFLCYGCQKGDIAMSDEPMTRFRLPPRTVRDYESPMKYRGPGLYKLRADSEEYAARVAIESRHQSDDKDKNGNVIEIVTKSEKPALLPPE